MRVLLIQPPVEDFYITSQRLQPTGLLYLAAFLSGRGHAVEVLDLLGSAERTAIPLDKDLEHLAPLIPDHPSPDTVFGDYCRFGAPRERIEAALRARTFDVCGISANFSAYFKTALETAVAVRKVRPAAFVVVGGNSVPVCFEEYLSSGCIDAAVFGEGENTMLALLACRERGSGLESVPNIAFVKNGAVARTGKKKNFDIEDSSIRLDFLDPGRYRIGKRRVLGLVTSRGCPGRCAYCTANLNCLSGHQRQSPEGVWRDISYNAGRHGITALDIEDENFTCDRDYALDFLARKTAGYPDLRLYFMNGLDYRTLDDGLLSALRKADLLNLGLALVDADQGNAGLLRRQSSVERIRWVVAKAKELGFLVTVYFIAGLPGQTKESLDRLVGFLSGLGVVIGMSVYYAVPGTRLFGKNRERFRDITFTRMRSTALWTGSETFTAADLFSLLARVRKLNLRLKD